MKQFLKSSRFQLVPALDHSGRRRRNILSEEIQQFGPDIIRSGHHREKKGVQQGYFLYTGEIPAWIDEENVGMLRDISSSIKEYLFYLIRRNAYHKRPLRKRIIKGLRRIFYRICQVLITKKSEAVSL